MIPIRGLMIMFMLAGGMLLQAQDPSETPAQNNGPQTTAQKAAQQLHTLYTIKDPVTGELRQPTKEELVAMGKQYHYTCNPDGITETVRADGGLSQAENRTFFHMIMVKFDENGNKSHAGCFNHLDAVNKFREPSARKKGEPRVADM